MTKFICVSGKAQHGKDTTAQALKELLIENGKKVEIIHYADLLKHICKSFFGWNGEKDEKGRTLLQYVGTDVVRTQKPNYWVEFVLGVVELFPNEWDYLIIPDCRFPNEITAMQKEYPTYHVRVSRSPDWVSPLSIEQQNHPSETALDNFGYDLLIKNYWDPATLADTIDEIVDSGYFE